MDQKRPLRCIRGAIRIDLITAIDNAMEWLSFRRYFYRAEGS